MLALPIFPASHPASIVGVCELNFCVRDGNRWTLATINTNSYGWLFTIFYVKTVSSSNCFSFASLFFGATLKRQLQWGKEEQRNE